MGDGVVRFSGIRSQKCWSYWFWSSRVAALELLVLGDGSIEIMGAGIFRVVAVTFLV